MFFGLGSKPVSDSFPSKSSPFTVAATSDTGGLCRASVIENARSASAVRTLARRVSRARLSIMPVLSLCQQAPQIRFEETGSHSTLYARMTPEQLLVDAVGSTPLRKTSVVAETHRSPHQSVPRSTMAAAAIAAWKAANKSSWHYGLRASSLCGDPVGLATLRVPLPARDAGRGARLLLGNTTESCASDRGSALCGSADHARVDCRAEPPMCKPCRRGVSLGAGETSCSRVMLDMPDCVLAQKLRPGVNSRTRDQWPPCLGVNRAFPRLSTQYRGFSTEYLPRVAAKRNRIPFQAFWTPRSPRPAAILREAEAAAAVTAASSHVAAPFTLQKQQRLQALLCAEDTRPADMASLFSTSPPPSADSEMMSDLDANGATPVAPTWLDPGILSAAAQNLPVGVCGLLNYRPSAPAATNFTFRGRVVKQLSVRRVNHTGRNCSGRVTVRHRGAGRPQRARFVDFKRGRKDIYATVLRLEYDPGRSAHIALIQYDDGVLSYILAAQTTRPGDRVVASENASITPANCLPLRCIPVNSIVHNVELRPGAGGQLVRAAGCFATVVAKDAQYATLKLQSTEIRRFPVACWASIGQVSNSRQAARIRGKAGVSCWLGERPKVKGKAMIPKNHPHGGGTGKTGVKRPPVSMWGILCRGYKTRSKHKPLGLIVRRKKPNKLIKKFGEVRGFV